MKKLLTFGLIFFLSGCTYFEGFQVLEEPINPPAPRLTETDVNRLIQQYVEANNLIPAGDEQEITINRIRFTADELDELTVELVDVLSLSVLGVVNENNLGNVNGTGSAVIFDYDGTDYYAITNNHVIETADVLKVYFNETDFAVAELVGTDPESDVAVLKFQTNRTVYVAPIADYSDVRVGQILLAIGSPSGFRYFNSVTMGIVSGTERYIGVTDSTGDGFKDIYQKMMQHDAAINPGNSGGPVFNLDGEIVGINTLKLVDDTIEGMGFSIPIDIVTRVVNDLREFGEVKRARLGVFVGDVRFLDDIDTELNYGVYVSDIIAGGAVERDTDLAIGDIITSLNGVRVDGLYMLKDILFQYYPGDVVVIGYDRNGESRTTTVTLGE